MVITGSATNMYRMHKSYSIIVDKKSTATALFITYCDRSLLHTVAVQFIAYCNKGLLQTATAILLQTATNYIKYWDRYYILRQVYYMR